MLPNTLPLETTQQPADALARTFRVFVRCDGRISPLQLIYNGPYHAPWMSLHHITLQIGEKTDKVSILLVKPCSDPTVPPIQLRHRGHPPVVRFLDIAAPRSVHFALSRIRELRWEPSPNGQPPGVLPSHVSFQLQKATQPTRDSWTQN